MTLTGTYTRSLDDKQRLAVPKPLREQFGGEELDRLFIAPETQRSLALFSPAEFERFAGRLERQYSKRAEFQNYLRLFYSRAAEVGLDGQGRIRIPERLVAHAGLGHEVVLIGVQDHAELWDAGTWQQFLDRFDAEFDDMARRAFDPP